MSWTDKVARETIRKLQKEFHIKIAMETGTYKGVNAEWLSKHFSRVVTIEKDAEYCKIAQERLGHLRRKNWEIVHNQSAQFLRWMIRTAGVYFLYLDAHFYDSSQKQKWVVVDELKALHGFGDCVICIHDFDNGVFDHLVYDGEPLGWNVIGEHIKKVNPNFFYYTNTECEPYTVDTIDEVTIDEVVLDNLRRYKGKDSRGILYAVPRELDLNKYKLRRL